MNSIDWQDLLDAAVDPVFALDLEARFIYANDAAGRLFGAAGDRLIGQAVGSHRTGPAEALAHLIERSLRDRLSPTADVFDPDTNRWYTAHAYLAERAVAVVLHDITDAKAAEAELRMSAAKFAGIIGISADAIISIDEQQRIIHFNRGAEEIFGYTAAEMIGQSIEILLPLRFRDAHAQHVQHFGESSEPARRMGERREISGLRKGGLEFPAEASISKIGEPGARIYTVVLRDATERKQHEESYQHAIATRDDVLSFVSHDLGNPLAAIRISTAVLLRGLAADSPQRPHIAGIREATEQAERLIRDLLDVKRLEAGKVELLREPVPVAALFDDCMEALEGLAAEKQITLTRQSEGVERVYVDRDRMRQVLTNLVSNAIKFSPTGATVWLRARNHEPGVIISVEDRGIGIPAEHLPHIFDRYWQAMRTGKAGHGLGLAIVDALVKLHGGKAWAESDAGRGSTFFILVPAAP